jgi:Ca-activated chloride channel family protein
MSSFTFQWPSTLLLICLLIPISWILHHARKQRKIILRSMGAERRTHRPIQDALRLIAWALIALAVARPGYAPYYEATSQTGRDVVFALDVSQSMLARDVSPNRLEVAKQGIRDALDQFSNDRVALIVYAGSASILCPLTYDYDFVRYMLEQANPRTVDFGGTTLQSAVEKAVDQIFDPERNGVQDLLILTDGGDHGSQMERVETLLAKSNTGLLIVGLGDPNNGSPILVAQEDGSLQTLEIDQQAVLTKLEDALLRNLSATYSNAEYIAAETRPFHLGQLYNDYATDKSTLDSNANSGKLIYQEAAIFFLIPGLICLLLAERWGLRRLGSSAIVLSLFFCGFPQSSIRAETALKALETDFEKATALMEGKVYDEALEILNATSGQSASDQLSAEQMAASLFNRGLCLIELSVQKAEESPIAALELAQKARLAFLQSKAYKQDFERAGLRIELSSRWIQELRDLIEKEGNQASDDSNPQSSEDGDNESFEDYEDMYEDDYSEMSESMPDSSYNEGDLAAGSSMQPLPAPNYTIEDILLEEKGNLQFRQQKRANANAAKVEKDY